MSVVIGGLYLHKKGNRYVVVGIGQNSNNGQANATSVEYISIEPGPRQGQKCHRDFSEFGEMVEWPDGIRRPRFTYEHDEFFPLKPKP